MQASDDSASGNFGEAVDPTLDSDGYRQDDERKTIPSKGQEDEGEPALPVSALNGSVPYGDPITDEQDDDAYAGRW